MRHVTRRRDPSARYARQIIAERRIEARTGREPARGSRILSTMRSPRAMRGDIVNQARAQWRNFDFCMSRVTNSYLR